MSHRAIPKVSLQGRKVPTLKGAFGCLEWLELSQLVIDTRYQREPGPRGEKHIRKIALEFDCRQFAPIICAPRNAAGQYAVIDGQHRCAAALARGDVGRVPAWVVGGEADLKSQAQAFMAINAKNARVVPSALWFARRAAGDPAAQTLFDLCERAGVEICRYAKPNRKRRYNETMATGEIDQAQRTHGDAVTLRALTVLVRASALAQRSLVVQGAIRAMVVLARENAWRMPDVEHVAQAFARLDYYALEAEAAVAAVKSGRARAEHVVELIRARMPAGGPLK